MDAEEFMGYYYRYKEIKIQLRLVQAKITELEQSGDQDRIKTYRKSEATALYLLSQLETKKSK